MLKRLAFTTIAFVALLTALGPRPIDTQAAAGRPMRPADTTMQRLFPDCGGLAYVTNPLIPIGAPGNPRLTFVSSYGCPGPPATISVLAGTDSTTCGSMRNLTFSVADAAGYPAEDGTAVAVSTSLGSVTTTVMTKGGTAVSSLVVPPKTAGTAEIDVAAGAATAQAFITIDCS